MTGNTGLQAQPSGVMALLQRLLVRALPPAMQGGAIAVTDVRLEADALVLHVSVAGAGGLIRGEQELRLTIVETNPERSRLALELPRAPGLGGLVNLGLRALPPQWLNEVLARRFGDAVSLQGEFVVLEHRPLIRRLLARKE